MIGDQSFTLLLGGARSGKSRMATALVGSWDGPAGIIATAEALDEEMTDRIERHRRSRPADWLVVEEPIDLEGALAGFDANAAVVVDCLTLWASNLMGQGLDDADIEALATRAAATAATRRAMTVVVSNEVGSGIVPANVMARRYRDLLGSVNAIWADLADRVLLTVAGGVVEVSRVAEILDMQNDG